MGREKTTSFQSYDKFRILSPNYSSFSTPLSGIPLHKELDRFQGCLVGGAVGDALGYTVEFLPEPELFTRFGATGITSVSYTHLDVYKRQVWVHQGAGSGGNHSRAGRLPEMRAKPAGLRPQGDSAPDGLRPGTVFLSLIHICHLIFQFDWQQGNLLHCVSPDNWASFLY